MHVYKNYSDLSFNYMFLKSNLLLSDSAWVNTPACLDSAGQLAACIKSTRSAAKVWARRNRAPHFIIPNCKFLIQLFDSFEEDRALSSAKFQVRKACHETLAQALKERAAFWRQRSKHRAILEMGMRTQCSTMPRQQCVEGTTTFVATCLAVEARTTLFSGRREYILFPY